MAVSSWCVSSSFSRLLLVFRHHRSSLSYIFILHLPIAIIYLIFLLLSFNSSNLPPFLYLFSLFLFLFFFFILPPTVLFLLSSLHFFLSFYHFLYFLLLPYAFLFSSWSSYISSFFSSLSFPSSPYVLFLFNTHSFVLNFPLLPVIFPGLFHLLAFPSSSSLP